MDVTTELNKLQYNWKRDRRHFKRNGIIPWDRCAHCGKPIDQESLNYCRRCDSLFMFKQAHEKGTPVMYAI